MESSSDQPLQVLSGLSVLPDLVASVIVVPSGELPSQWIFPHCETDFVSWGTESRVPVASYSSASSNIFPVFPVASISFPDLALCMAMICPASHLANDTKSPFIST